MPYLMGRLSNVARATGPERPLAEYLRDDYYVDTGNTTPATLAMAAASRRLSAVSLNSGLDREGPKSARNRRLAITDGSERMRICATAGQLQSGQRARRCRCADGFCGDAVRPLTNALHRFVQEGRSSG